MAKRQYLAVGQWRHGLAGELGIRLFQCDPGTGSMTLCDWACPEITAGQLCVDESGDTLYVAEEVGHVEGNLGGGAYVHAFRLEKDGKLVHLNRARTVSPYPCSLALTKSGKYLLVSHNADKEHVTKIRRLAGGGFASETVYDDAALALFRMEEDGAIGAIKDVFVAPSGGVNNPRAVFEGGNDINAWAGMMSHLHCVAASPDGQFSRSVIWAWGSFTPSVWMNRQGN